MATGRDRRHDIANYLSQSTRNRLVFCHAPIERLTFANIGVALSAALKTEDLRSPLIAYTAEDILGELMSSYHTDALIGSYVAIENIGILFEPNLGFNLKSLFDNYSRERVLIICSEGTIHNHCFYFYQDGDGYAIDLKDLSYIEI